MDSRSSFFFLSTPSALSIPISRWISSPPLVAQLPSASIRSNDRQTDSKKNPQSLSAKSVPLSFQMDYPLLKKRRQNRTGGSTHTHTQKSRRNNPIDLIQSNGVAFYLFILLFFLLFTLVRLYKKYIFLKTPSSIPLNFSTDLIGQGGVIEGGTRRRRNGPGTMTPASGRKEGEKESKMKSEK